MSRSIPEILGWEHVSDEELWPVPQYKTPTGYHIGEPDVADMLLWLAEQKRVQSVTCGATQIHGMTVTWAQVAFHGSKQYLGHFRTPGEALEAAVRVVGETEPAKEETQP